MAVSERTNEVERLRSAHAEIDEALADLHRQARPDDAQIVSFKKRKLSIKDRLARLDRH
ncbi:MAG: DUF465 domain-containing protein [Alphaproteobacteria bacterium]|nr:DUF465 domain-containing protein [Alphaproteobacteria bacterium]